MCTVTSFDKCFHLSKQLWNKYPEKIKEMRQAILELEFAIMKIIRETKHKSVRRYSRKKKHTSRSTRKKKQTSSVKNSRT